MREKRVVYSELRELGRQYDQLAKDVSSYHPSDREIARTQMQVLAMAVEDVSREFVDIVRAEQGLPSAWSRGAQ